MVSIPSLIFFYSSSILTSFFNGSGKAYYLPLVQILPVLLQITLSYFFSLKWNLKGAMIALSIGQLSYSFILIFIFLKAAKINIMYLIPNSSDFQYTYNFIKNSLNYTNEK
jgi:Na+-driven multidrug efflux pump